MNTQQKKTAEDVTGLERAIECIAHELKLDRGHKTDEKHETCFGVRGMLNMPLLELGPVPEGSFNGSEYAYRVRIVKLSPFHGPELILYWFRWDGSVFLSPHGKSQPEIEVATSWEQGARDIGTFMIEMLRTLHDRVQACRFAAEELHGTLRATNKELWEKFTQHPPNLRATA